MLNLIVTQGGRAMPDQALGVRLFKDAAGAKERYRLVWFRSWGWRVFFCGRDITDPPHCRAPGDVGPVLDYLKKVRSNG